MKQSPMEYFESQDFGMSDQPKKGMSAAEMAFIRKYMGMDPAQALAAVPPVTAADREPARPYSQSGAPQLSPHPAGQSSPVASPRPASAKPVVNTPAAPAPAHVPAELPDKPVPAEDSVEAGLRDAESVQLVGFYVGNQLYALPTLAIQEVIRRQEPSQLPMAPAFVSGVINLRGHITPLVRMRVLLGIQPESEEPERFTIICRSQGLQFGVEIDQLQTMYRVMQQDLNWNAEASIGANVEFITGLFKVEDRLIPIVSIERLVEKVLNA